MAKDSKPPPHRRGGGAARRGAPGPGHPFTGYRLRNNTGGDLKRARLDGTARPAPEGVGGSTEIWNPPVTDQDPLKPGMTAIAVGVSAWNHITGLTLSLFGAAPDVSHVAPEGTCIASAQNDPKSETPYPHP